MDKNEFRRKILVLGDTLVGKTKILMRYVDGKYNDLNRATIGVDFKTKNVKTRDGKSIKLKIWDTNGVERFRDIIKPCYKGTDGIILIYDVTNINSFNNLKNWLKDIKLNVYHNTPIIVVGNKNDNEKYRRVTKEQGKNFSEKNGLIFSECSAKTGENIDYIFNELTENILLNEEKERIREKIEEKSAEKKMKILKKYISF